MNGNLNALITAKNVGIVTIICAATATVIVLNQKNSSILTKTSSKKRKQKIHSSSNKQSSISPTKLSALQHDLEKRRQKILNEFEKCGHKSIPEEMLNTIDYIYNDLESSLYPPHIRLLTSQLIQDYAIMYTNIESKEPDPKIINLAKEWLDFNCSGGSHSLQLQIEQINHRYALALRSRSIKEFKSLFLWLQRMDSSIKSQASINQNWILRCFQCACLLGQWLDVEKYGILLESVKPESLAANGQQQAPLHPLHLFEYIALKLPNQSANFTQIYYNVNKYINKFDERLCPPLKFNEWTIKQCSTMLVYGFSSNPKRNLDLINQINISKQKGNHLIPVPSTSRFMFVYGCLVQFPCFWVQLPASNTKMQPVVLTGPWNDTEMELTASYIRRVPKNNAIDGKSKKIRVVRSDLRLTLDRSNPWKLKNGDDHKEEFKNNNKLNGGGGVGWNWKGSFEHEEGLLECFEDDLNNFKFRRDTKWSENALKFTCRRWECHMVITTPD